MSRKIKYFLVGKRFNELNLYLQISNDGSNTFTICPNDAFRFTSSDFNDSLLAFIADNNLSVFRFEF